MFGAFALEVRDLGAGFEMRHGAPDPVDGEAADQRRGNLEDFRHLDVEQVLLNRWIKVANERRKPGLSLLAFDVEEAGVQRTKR